MTFIYALKCPITGAVRYVGKSNNPKKRLLCHRYAQEICHRTNWVKSLRARGLRPVLEIVDEVPFEYWQQLEIAYIEFFREIGCNLVNGNAGGEGGHTPSVETIAKRRVANLGEKNPNFGREYSPEERAKQGRPGEKHPCFGKIRSPETCAKIRASLLGKKRSLESRLKQAASVVGDKNPFFGKKHTAESKAKRANTIKNKLL